MIKHRYKPMRFDISGFFALLFFIVCYQSHADNLESLPAHWQQQLKTVEPIDPALLKPGVGNNIAPARTKVDSLLQLAEPDAKQLATAYGKLGNLYLTHGLYTSAEACYNNAIQLAPEHFPWRYYYAYLSQENGNMAAALSRFKQAREIDASYLPAQYRLAQVYLDLNRLDEAYGLFSSLLNNEEFEAAAHYGIGQIQMLRQDYTEAAKHLTLALELAPQATSLHYPLALSLRATGKTELAKQHLQQYKKRDLVVKDPLVESLEALKDPGNRHFVEAMTAVIRKDFNKAIKEFEAGLALKPENTAARTSYARVLYLTGDEDKSRAQLELTINKDPNKTIALFLLALLDDESDNKEKAIASYKRVIEIDATHEGANFFLGNYYLHHKNYSKAIEHYDTVLLGNDKNIPAHIFRLASMMSSNASDRELLAASRKITGRAPNLVAVKRIQILLLALSREPDVRDSQLSLSLAEEMYNNHPHPVNLELLSIATASTGDFSLAVEQMQKAIAAEKQHQQNRNLERMNHNQGLLKKGKLPELDWHGEINQMLPPPTRALATFRDYPDANPI